MEYLINHTTIEKKTKIGSSTQVNCHIVEQMGVQICDNDPPAEVKAYSTTYLTDFGFKTKVIVKKCGCPSVSLPQVAVRSRSWGWQDD